jgi:hypothetical protein
MGHGTYEPSASAARATYRAATHTTAFTHDVDAKAGRVSQLHESMDFKLKPYRESRDSDKGPSTPVAVLCDVTGSMSRIPELLIKDLNKLMSTIQKLGVVSDPHLLFGAIGDATCDDVPVQMGEFEASDELVEQHLSNIYLEGGGGGQNMESYELFLYLFAKAVQTDAWDKRGEKGFLFIIGDERNYPTVRKDLVKKYLNLEMSEDMTLEAVAAEVQERWEVFCFRPGGTSNYNSAQVQKQWEDILPEERVIKVEDWERIVPQMAGIVSVMSGAALSDTIAAMKSAGFSDSVINGASTSLATMETAPLATVVGETSITGTDSTAEHGVRL